MKNKRASSNPLLDRLPPHSIEAEQGVLGCCLLAPEICIQECSSKINGSDAFYDLRHQTIYDAMVGMDKAGGKVDIITLHDRLKTLACLEEVGGLAYLESLPEMTPSAANLPYYLEIILGKHHLRKLIKTCTRAASAAYEDPGDVALLLDTAERDISQMFSKFNKSGDNSETWTINQLAAYDTKRDPNAVIGIKDGATTRYLCRGYGAWIIGQSGIGKSAITHQQAYLWALGRPFMGMTPVFPVRVIIVQSENDIGDNSETAQGILDSIPDITPDIVQTLNERVRIVRCRGRTGLSFCQWLQREIKAWKADICYVDPLLRFAGIDVSRQDQCTQFLNNCLDPVLANTDAIIIGAHHTGKPKGDRENKNSTIYDKAYSGIGSSELVNWARAVSIIEARPDGSFQMLLAKRGSRAWATHPNGDLTTSIFMRHAPDKIYWIQTDPPEIEYPAGKGKPAGRKSKVDEIATSNLYEFCAGCKTEGEGKNEIAQRLEAYLAKNRTDASFSSCKRAIEALVANAKLEKTAAGLYVKGKEA